MKEFFTVINEVTDISNEMGSFSTDEVSLELTTLQTLKIGFRKAFALMYFELSTPNTNPATLTATYDNSDGNQSLKIVDETKGFTRSGFIKFERPEDIVDTTALTISKKYINIKTSVDFSVGTKLKGVGIVFCNEQDLIDIRANIISKLNNGNSLISKIALARDHMVAAFNQQGNFKIVTDPTSTISTGTVLSDINEFDFLSIDQLRLSNAYKAASLFFLEEKSDEPEDKWEVQGRRYRKSASDLSTAYFMNLDLDDDGKADVEELNQTTVTRLSLD